MISPVRLGTFLRVAPNGARIAFAPSSASAGEDAGNVWIYDVNGNRAARRLTYEGTNRFPVWTSDSTRVVFQSDREGDLAIFWQKADGTGRAERLTRPEKGTSHLPESWSPTSDTLLYSVESPSGFTLWSLSVKTGQSAPFGDVRSVFPIDARFSPDGKWIAYVVAERPGPTSIYVQPFPATGARNQLTVRGGSNNTPHKPMWSPDGKELFYVPRYGDFEAVAVTTHPEFGFGSARPVLRPFQSGAPNTRAMFDIAPDGRFLALFHSEGPRPLPPMREIAVVLNWFEEIRMRVPGP